MQAGQQNAQTKLGIGLQRGTEQNQMMAQGLTDEYQRGVDQTNYNIDNTLTGLQRSTRDSNFGAAERQNRSTYEQALLDLIYGNQSLNKSYEMGASTAEQNRQTTMQSRDIDQLQQIALQKSALSQAMSQVQGGLFSGGGGGGSPLAAAIDGIGGLFKQGMGVYQTMQNGNMMQPQQNYSYQMAPQQYAFSQPSTTQWNSPAFSSGFTGNTASLPSFGR